jgi:hypothetical protein
VVTSSTSVSVVASQSASIQLAASNSPLSYNVTGLPTGLTVNAATGLITGSTATAGVYTLTVSANNATGTGPSASIALTVSSPGGGGGVSVAPSITAAPASLSVTVGGAASFTVAVAGTAPFTYQWLKNGTAISGATGSSFTLSAVQATDAGSYSVAVTNGVGTTTSASATLTVLAIVTPVAITTQPSTQSVVVGGTTTLTVAATGSGTLTYQWLRNGTAIAGATGASLTLTNLARGGSASYSVIVTGSGGSVTSNAAALTVLASRLINLSVHAVTGTGSQALDVGFVVGGSGTDALLVRGIGPTLSQFGLAGVISATQLSLFDSSSTVIASDTGWGNAPVTGPSLVDASVAPASAAIFAQVAAFALPTGSADSALVPTLPVGAYTAQVGGVGSATGVALAEVYDLDVGTPSSRLINISARASVGTGSAALATGFVVSGPAPEMVLIRGIGPTLAAFGVSGVLAAPQLTVYDSSSQVIVTDTGWSNALVAGPSTAGATFQPATAGTFSLVAAFPLSAGSDDCAVLMTLPPGVYTAQVSGVSNSTGVGLIEVYETQ